MMRNRIEMRFLALALAAAMTVAALSGCGKGGQSGKENTQAQTEQESAPEETPAAEEPAPAETAPAEPSAEETPAAGETPAAQEPEKPEPSTPAEPEQPAAPAQETPASPSAEQDPGQKLWPDGKFALNGVAYQLPVPQTVLAEAGWTVRFENTQNPAAFKMQPGEVINAELTLAGYEEAMVVTAEFENIGTETILLGECPLTALYITASEAALPMPAEPAAEGGTAPAAGTEEQAAVYLPVLELEPGITWGSSAQEIAAAYGEPTFSGSGSSRFDCMYENTSFYLEFLGEPERGVRQLIYCIN